MGTSALLRASRTMRFAAILRDAAKTPLLRVRIARPRRNHQPQNVIVIPRADVILVPFNDDSSPRNFAARHQAGCT